MLVRFETLTTRYPVQIELRKTNLQTELVTHQINYRYQWFNLDRLSTVD